MLVLLDRDGVLNVDRPDSVLRAEELEVLPMAAEAVALFNRRGWKVAVVSNQSVIGKGLLSEAELARIHARLCDEIRSAGAEIDAFFVCPDLPDSASWRRKPNPGMLLEALAQFKAQPAQTPMVGDALRDMEAAAKAGCPRYLTRTGKGEASLREGLPDSIQPVEICDNVLDAAHRILQKFSTQ